MTLPERLDAARDGDDFAAAIADFMDALRVAADKQRDDDGE